MRYESEAVKYFPLQDWQQNSDDAFGCIEAEYTNGYPVQAE